MIDLTALDASVQELVTETGMLRTELAEVGRRQDRQARLTWGAVLVGGLLILLIVVAVLDNRRAVVANNRLLCPVLAIVGSNDPPRTTEAGQKIVAEIDRLGRLPAYGCW